MLSKDILIY